MNTKLLLLLLIIAGISSCSTAYKAGQTPDDVYYSPVRPQNDYVRTEKDEDKTVYRDNTIYEDRSIRRDVHNRRWRRDNDYDYNYPYGNQYPNVYIDPKTGVATKAPRKVNLGGYKKPVDNTQPTDSGFYKGRNRVPPTNNPAPNRTFKQSTNNGTGVGNFIREIFSGQNTRTNADNSSSNNDNTTPTRTFGGTYNNTNNNSNSNSNSNSGKGSSGSAPVRTFDKN